MTKQYELPLSQWHIDKNGVLHWCGGYVPDSLVGYYFRHQKKAIIGGEEK